MISVCQSGSWSNGYGYTPLLGTVSGECKGCTLLSEKTLKENNIGLIVQNPVIDIMNIITTNDKLINENIELCLESLNGLVVYKDKLTISGPMFSIPINHIPSGFYILKTNHNEQFQINKILILKNQ